MTRETLKEARKLLDEIEENRVEIRTYKACLDNNKLHEGNTIYSSFSDFWIDIPKDKMVKFIKSLIKETEQEIKELNDKFDKL